VGPGAHLWPPRVSELALGPWLWSWHSGRRRTGAGVGAVLAALGGARAGSESGSSPRGAARLLGARGAACGRAWAGG